MKLHVYLKIGKSCSFLRVLLLHPPEEWLLCAQQKSSYGKLRKCTHIQLGRTYMYICIHTLPHGKKK